MNPACFLLYISNDKPFQFNTFALAKDELIITLKT